MQPGPHGRFFATRFVPVMLALGIGGGLVLAGELDGRPLSTDFWKTALTLTGVSVLPLVVLGMRAPGFAATHWREWSTVCVIAGFVVAMLVLGACLYEIGRVVPQGQQPPEPDWLRLRVVCGGAGAIIAGIACLVVTDFFMGRQTMEPAPGEQRALLVGRHRRGADPPTG
jgi:hypothetical protein